MPSPVTGAVAQIAPSYRNMLAAPQGERTKGSGARCEVLRLGGASEARKPMAKSGSDTTVRADTKDHLPGALFPCSCRCPAWVSPVGVLLQHHLVWASFRPSVTASPEAFSAVSVPLKTQERVRFRRVVTTCLTGCEQCPHVMIPAVLRRKGEPASPQPRFVAGTPPRVPVTKLHQSLVKFRKA